jgi:hypothetical protein
MVRSTLPVPDGPAHELRHGSSAADGAHNLINRGLALAAWHVAMGSFVNSVRPYILLDAG